MFRGEPLHQASHLPSFLVPLPNVAVGVWGLTRTILLLPSTWQCGTGGY